MILLSLLSQIEFVLNMEKMFPCRVQNKKKFKYRRNPNYCKKITNCFNFWTFSISNNSYSAIKNIERNINIKVL